jgi:hypothetical protein
LNDAEKARLAGAIWIHGSINIEHSRKRNYYYPRIMLSMRNPLPFDYQKDTGGKVWAGKDGCITLEIGKQELVGKRLKEVLPLMGGIEKEQIGIALQIIEIGRTERPRTEKGKKEKRKKLKKLYDQFKELSDKLENWIQVFKAEHKDVKRKRIPAQIWNKAYRLEDC